jgi:GntR family transcriptional repressor for pyruvate dehydrogenase complex
LVDVEPLEKKTLVDLLTTKLREEILNGRYVKGATLPPERELADALRVNRTSLKHALMRLEQLGLIAIRHGIGSVVLDPAETAGTELIAHLVFRADGIDAAMLDDLIEARTLLGAFLARLASERRSGADLVALAAPIAEIAREATSVEDVQRLELEFFRSLVRATGNRVFALVANSMFSIYRSRAHVFRRAFEDREFLGESLERIVIAVRDGEPGEAEHATLEYLKENGKRLLHAALLYAQEEHAAGRRGLVRAPRGRRAAKA